MRYYYEKPDIWVSMYGEIYRCNAPLYSSCTLYRYKKKGLAVIQQRFDPLTKRFWWSDIDPWLANDIYLNEGFPKYFIQNAREPEKDIYPTVTVRQIMWALRMKPLKKEYWEDS